MVYYESHLSHHGIKGQKWGVRRFRNADGSLTPAGEKRYDDMVKSAERLSKKVGSSRTRIGNDFQNFKAWNAELRAKKLSSRVEDQKNGVKGLRRSHGNSAAGLEATSEFYKRQAEYSKGKNKKKAEIAAFNYASEAAAQRKLHDSKTVSEYAKNKISNTFNRAIKTNKGKESTTGKEMLKTGAAIVAGLAVKYTVKALINNVANQRAGKSAVDSFLAIDRPMVELTQAADGVWRMKG